MTQILKVAVQKSGRLFDGSLKLLEECGIEFAKGKVALKSRATNFPLEIYFLRDDDIPAYIVDQVVDAGIVGSNTIEESGLQMNIVERLSFARCRLSLAVPIGSPYQSAHDLKQLRIATSHPRLLKSFLESQRVQASVHEMSGSVEITPAIGLADAICDLVSTGSTLTSNGLREIEIIYQSEAVLATSNKRESGMNTLMERLQFRIQSVLRARRTKYIMLNAPNDSLETIAQLLPGAKSPSLIPLSTPGWTSLHSVVQEDDFWEVIEKLKAAGAEGILVLPIQKMIL